MASVNTPNVNHCPQCNAPKLAHRVCMACGFYKGTPVVDVKKSDEGDEAKS